MASVCIGADTVSRRVRRMETDSWRKWVNDSTLVSSRTRRNAVQECVQFGGYLPRPRPLFVLPPLIAPFLAKSVWLKMIPRLTPARVIILNPSLTVLSLRLMPRPVETILMVAGPRCRLLALPFLPVSPLSVIKPRVKHRVTRGMIAVLSPKPTASQDPFRTFCNAIGSTAPPVTRRLNVRRRANVMIMNSNNVDKMVVCKAIVWLRLRVPTNGATPSAWITVIIPVEIYPLRRISNSVPARAVFVRG